MLGGDRMGFLANNGRVSFRWTWFFCVHIGGRGISRLRTARSFRSSQCGFSKQLLLDDLRHIRFD